MLQRTFSANYWWKFYSDRTRKKNTFKAIEKYRYGLWKSVSKHLKTTILQQITKKKFITHTPTNSAFCDKNQSLIKSVWNYTKRQILWTSFTRQVIKLLALLANCHRPFIIVQWFLECQTNTLNGCFLILTTFPASKLTDCYS